MSGRVLHTATNQWKDTIAIYEDSVIINIAKRSWLDRCKPVGCIENPSLSPGEKLIYTKDIIYIEFDNGDNYNAGCNIHIDIKNADRITFYLIVRPASARGKAKETSSVLWPIAQHLGKIAGLNCVRDYKEEVAIGLFDRFLLDDEAKRIRKRMQDEGKVKVDQTIVHGDYVDDRDTIVKDSVISKSNIGAGGKSKAEQIREIKELLDSGAISDEDYEKMKREIIG